jgi:tetratricopeptide (TPR) repeat protein
LADAFHLRGTLRFHKQDLQRAVADFNHAIELNPRLAQAYGNRGFVRLLQGQDAIAEEDFAQCIKLDPGSKPRLDQWIETVRQSRKITR